MKTVPWRLGGPHHYQPLATRPWATVADGDGFPDAPINRYLTFLAWQDWAPTTVRADARALAAAATWLDFVGYGWAEATEATWARYYGDTMVGRPRARDRALRHVMTLHRAYAFWHWDNPRTIPFQPFPRRTRDRVAWLDHALVTAITRRQR